MSLLIMLSRVLAVVLQSLNPFDPIARGALARGVVRGFLAVDGTVALIALGAAGLLWLGTPLPLLAAPPFQEGAGELAGGVAIGAALATGLAAIGAGIGVGIAGAAAIGAIAEKPETLGRTLIFVGLAEGVAIYGLIISFMILTR
ncbi:MAG: ATP synthase subunit C [Ardenticatenaceae bacterium]|nr:ATP synthase subunit C [Ardenticatenaceae bacterium]